jgi:hypothetical protein
MIVLCEVRCIEGKLENKLTKKHKSRDSGLVLIRFDKKKLIFPGFFNCVCYFCANVVFLLISLPYVKV